MLGRHFQLSVQEFEQKARQWLGNPMFGGTVAAWDSAVSHATLSLKPVSSFNFASREVYPPVSESFPLPSLEA